MNREQVEEAIKVMQAWLEGEQIEYSPKGLNIWNDIADADPVWGWHDTTYRVKPKKKTEINWDHLKDSINWVYFNSYNWYGTDVKPNYVGEKDWLYSASSYANTVVRIDCLSSFIPGDDYLLERPQKKEGGWIEWKGGESKIPYLYTSVQVRYKDGTEEVDDPFYLDWGWCGWPSDIVAYRVVT